MCHKISCCITVLKESQSKSQINKNLHNSFFRAGRKRLKIHIKCSFEYYVP